MDYVKEFRSDLGFQMEALKRVLRYHRRGTIILLSLYIPFMLASVLVARGYYSKYGLISLYWVIYPVIVIAIPLIPQLTPKTYKTHLKGIFINGHIHRWKNFHSYFVDDSFLYLTKRIGRWEVVCLALPKDFEDVVKEFVKKNYPKYSSLFIQGIKAIVTAILVSSTLEMTPFVR